MFMAFFAFIQEKIPKNVGVSLFIRYKDSQERHKTDPKTRDEWEEGKITWADRKKVRSQRDKKDGMKEE